MFCRTTSLYDKNRTTISYDFYRSSDISFSSIAMFVVIVFRALILFPRLLRSSVVNLKTENIIYVINKAAFF